jgi:magnesium-transporting ATPase (P-type)
VLIPPKDILKRKPTGNKEKIINKRIVLLTVFIGLKKVVIMFLMFYFMYRMTGNLRLAQTI